VQEEYKRSIPVRRAHNPMIGALQGSNTDLLQSSRSFSPDARREQKQN
jgi:hypothetical protein